MRSFSTGKRVTRRQFAIGGALGLVALKSGGFSPYGVAAQGAGDLSTLGFPTLEVTLTDNEFQGLPETTPAGRYLLKLTSQVSGSSDNVGTVGFVSPTPVGMSAADFIAGFLGGGSPDSGATPAEGASPDKGEDAGEQSGALPLVVYQMHFAGGANAAPGQTSMAVIDLSAGEYVVWGDDPTVGIKPSVLNVTGDMPSDLADPDSDITATLIDFAIQIDGNLAAGKHIIKVQHMGAQPHYLDIEKGPDGMTLDQVTSSLNSDMSGTPAADGIDESALQATFYSPTQSIGTTTWHELDLAEGTYLAACFFPTAGTGVPHAMNGMVDVFTTSGTGTPTA